MDGEQNSKNNENLPDTEVGTVDFHPSELAVIFDWLEDRYHLLFGKGKAADYEKRKKDEWVKFVSAVNAIFRGANNRTKESIKKKINNMRQQGITYYLRKFYKCNEMTKMSDIGLCNNYQNV